jgi:RimJ/RimL family protein N-acetyltransferase
MEGRRINLADRSGEKCEIRLCEPHDLASLMEMYAVFSPRPASQGLPPADREVCAEWVKGLLEIGVNISAWKGERLIGHAALIPDVRGQSSEFVIFVHQEFRNLGIGTALAAATLERAKTLGFSSVWLTVAVTNFIAIRLYRKLHFEYSDMDDCERTMVLGL